MTTVWDTAGTLDLPAVVSVYNEAAGLEALVEREGVEAGLNRAGLGQPCRAHPDHEQRSAAGVRRVGRVFRQSTHESQATPVFIVADVRRQLLLTSQAKLTTRSAA
jgi:hypothetical protein